MASSRRRATELGCGILLSSSGDEHGDRSAAFSGLGGRRNYKDLSRQLQHSKDVSHHLSDLASSLFRLICCFCRLEYSNLIHEPTPTDTDSTHRRYSCGAFASVHGTEIGRRSGDRCCLLSDRCYSGLSL